MALTVVPPPISLTVGAVESVQLAVNVTVPDVSLKFLKYVFVVLVMIFANLKIYIILRG